MLMKLNEKNKQNWQSLASVEMLTFRAETLNKIRTFFEKRHVLEVETPLLMPAPVTDPFIETFNFKTMYGQGYLQSSPEYAMKRLLASGFSDIYQICKAFRNEEISKNHNPEFSMLEWYRSNFDHFQLMDELKDLILFLSPNTKIESYTYRQVFEKYLNINPHTISLDQLQNLVDKKIGQIIGLEKVTRYHALELLFSYEIEPNLEKNTFIFIYHYTKEQSALAKIIETEEGEVAARFECFFKGLELANGYYELCDEIEQKKRFKADLKTRKKEGKVQVPIDENLLLALKSGISDCSGVALGIDRLIMALSDSESIENVLGFRW